MLAISFCKNLIIVIQINLVNLIRWRFFKIIIELVCRTYVHNSCQILDEQDQKYKKLAPKNNKV